MILKEAERGYAIEPDGMGGCEALLYRYGMLSHTVYFHGSDAFLMCVMEAKRWQTGSEPWPICEPTPDCGQPQ